MFSGRPLLNCSRMPISLPFSSARAPRVLDELLVDVDHVAGEVVAHVERVRTQVAIQVARIRASRLGLHRQLRQQRRVVGALGRDVLEVVGQPLAKRFDHLERHDLNVESPIDCTSLM